VKRTRSTPATQNGRRDKIRMSKNGHARRPKTPRATGQGFPQLPTSGDRRTGAGLNTRMYYSISNTSLSSENIINPCPEAREHTRSGRRGKGREYFRRHRYAGGRAPFSFL